MESYDPEQPIDPEGWNALDEAERQVLVERHHRKIHIKVPNLRAHAAIHVAVENQVALGDEIPTQKTLRRLMSEGLSRHDAVHSIGSVLAEHLWNLFKDDAKDEDPNAEYFRQLEELTAESWRKNYGEESEEDDQEQRPAGE